MNIYFSVDIETDGLAAGINSLISLGVAAIDVDSGLIMGTFKRNLRPAYGMQVCQDTMNWWKGFPEAYKRATESAWHPSAAIEEFVGWVNAFGIEKPVSAAWKPGFDLAFLRYYLHRFGPGDIFGRSGSGLDIKTLTAVALNQTFSETQIATVPTWMKGPITTHSHDALEDAIEQAHVMYNARKMLNSKI